MKSTLLAAVAGLVLVAGCSDTEDSAADAAATTVVTTAGSDDAPGSDAPGTSAPTTVAATAADVATTVATSEASAPPTSAQTVIDIENQPGEGTFDGALQDADFTCEPDATGWVASGTVTNPTDAPVGYRIFMSFLDGAGETVALVEAETDLADVAPGESREWEAGFESDAEDLTCVARVERRAAD